MTEHWNRRFSEAKPVYGTKPNVFYATELARLAPGRILFPGEGQGRNAVHAAQQGWEVVAFDPSSVAQASALTFAQSKGVKLDYQLHGYESFVSPPHHFDCLVLIFAHMPAAMRQTWHQRLLGFLRPGGTLILQGFAKSQLGLPSGGPKDIGMLFSSAEIRSDFAEMTELEVQKTQVLLDEGPYHQGWAQVISAVGTR